MSDEESAATYFSHHCNKLVNGNCRTTNCLHRGGYISGGETDPHWDDATCEALEAVNAFVEIAALKAEIERLRELDKVSAKVHNSNLVEMREMREVIERLKTMLDLEQTANRITESHA